MLKKISKITKHAPVPVSGDLAQMDASVRSTLGHRSAIVRIPSPSSTVHLHIMAGSRHFSTVLQRYGGRRSAHHLLHDGAASQSQLRLSTRAHSERIPEPGTHVLQSSAMASSLGTNWLRGPAYAHSLCTASSACRVWIWPKPSMGCLSKQA